MEMTTSSSTSAPAASSSSSMAMGGTGGGDACKISMLWNWYTVDACFLSSQWRIRSPGMMAGSCIGVVCLVVVLEALRRAAREYDAYILRSHTKMNPSYNSVVAMCDSNLNGTKDSSTLHAAQAPKRFTPNVFQQLVRALLHMLQFAVAYFVMLLAMYFNGYFIICILIGAFLGAFAFNWQSLDLP